MIIRLDKFLSDMNLGTRSEVRQLVKTKRISVNNILITDGGYKIDTEKDIVCFDKKIINYKKHTYIIMNKPKGYITATQDKKQKTVFEIIPDKYKRKNLFPAGRLDKDTTGLLILTDDGEFAHNMMSPKKHVEKTYVAKIEKPLCEDAQKLFAEGIVIGDYRCKPAKLRYIDSATVEITISEGKYHQVKLMVKAAKSKVIALHRKSIGQLEIPSSLAEGECAEIDENEIKTLINNTQKT